MSRDGLRQKKCGCLVFTYGPPVLCPTHEVKAHKKQASLIRQFAQKQSRDLGHDLTPWKEYGSQVGKYTAYCRDCGAIAIAYDDTPALGDQIAGKALTAECRGGSREFNALRDDPREEASSDEHGSVETESADGPLRTASEL